LPFRPNPNLALAPPGWYINLMQTVFTWFIAAIWLVAQGLPCCCMAMANQNDHIASAEKSSEPHSCCHKAKPLALAESDDQLNNWVDPLQVNPTCCKGPTTAVNVGATSPTLDLTLSPLWVEAILLKVAPVAFIVFSVTPFSELGYGPPRYLVNRRLIC
jgi:hypothetical protein